MSTSERNQFQAQTVTQTTPNTIILTQKLDLSPFPSLQLETKQGFDTISELFLQYSPLQANLPIPQAGFTMATTTFPQLHGRKERHRRLVNRDDRGLNRLYRNKLKKMKISKTCQSCSICQETFIKDQIILQLPCKHIFHRMGCITQWLKCSIHCPICKFDLLEHFRSQKGLTKPMEETEIN